MHCRSLGLKPAEALIGFLQYKAAEEPGINRITALGKRLHKLMATANLPYHSPHKFRHGHAVFALQHAQTMADYKAVSMNLMHGDIRVTDGIYAPLAHAEVKHRISSLTEKQSEESSAFPGLGVSQGLSDEQLLAALKQRLQGAR